MRICSIEGCEDKHVGLGYCSKHYQKLKRFGDPLGGSEYVRRGDIPKWINELLEGEEEGCIMWPFSLQTNGYGTITVNGQARMAHRYICERAHGPSPTEGMIVRHLCGKGHESCVNPRHLKWGTYLENSQDTRDHETIARGEKQGSNKLSEESVLEIFRRVHKGESQYELAREFNVGQVQISRIKLGKQWSWLTNGENKC